MRSPLAEVSSHVSVRGGAGYMLEPLIMLTHLLSTLSLRCFIVCACVVMFMYRDVYVAISLLPTLLSPPRPLPSPAWSLAPDAPVRSPLPPRSPAVLEHAEDPALAGRLRSPCRRRPSWRP